MQLRLECDHPNLHNRNCVECGLYIYSEMKVSGLKTEAYRATYPGHTHISYLRRLAAKFEKSIPQYCKLQEVKNAIESLVEVLGLNRETYAQALYIYEVAAYEMIKRKLYDAKYAVLYTAASVVLAAKIIYPQRAVPPMEGIKRILNCNYGKKELCKAERLILKMLNYEIPNFSFLDFLNFYLMNGGIFTNQHFRDPVKFEHKLDGIIWSYVKDGQFMQYDQQSLAAYILYKARKDIKVSEVWNWHIQHYTHINGDRLRAILQSMQTSPRVTPQLHINELVISSDRVLTVSNTPRERVKVMNKLTVEQSIQYIKRGYSNIKRERSNSQSHCNTLQPVRTGSSLNKFAFRVE